MILLALSVKKYKTIRARSSVLNKGKIKETSCTHSPDSGLHKITRRFSFVRKLNLAQKSFQRYWLRLVSEKSVKFQKKTRFLDHPKLKILDFVWFLPMIGASVFIFWIKFHVGRVKQTIVISKKVLQTILRNSIQETSGILRYF